MENQVPIYFLTPQGRYCGRVQGRQNGNVLLRREQYRWADDKAQSLSLAKLFLVGKLTNGRKVLRRGIRDHGESIDKGLLLKADERLTQKIEDIEKVTSPDILLGIEGSGAQIYFEAMDELIRSQKEDFFMKKRTKRPPLDKLNAMLSFAYTLLASEVQSALETVGLDPYVGFFHTDRPGRASLAMDMIEELRPYMADRFVLSLVNKKEINKEDFLEKENGTVLMNDQGRKKFLDKWQKRKHEKKIHPFIDEQVEIGLIPYVQAQLLARHIRADIDMYPPFFIV